MNVKRAYSFAEELGALKYFPSNIAAVTKIAEVIADICADEKQAQKLVDVMCKRFDEWPGPVTLRTLHGGLFGRKDEPVPYSLPPAPPPPICPRCCDNGLYKNQHELYQRCECSAATWVSDSELDIFNAWQKKRAMPTAEIIVKRRIQ